jgi:hypothetical protein
MILLIYLVVGLMDLVSPRFKGSQVQNLVVPTRFWLVGWGVT